MDGSRDDINFSNSNLTQGNLLDSVETIPRYSEEFPLKRSELACYILTTPQHMSSPGIHLAQHTHTHSPPPPIFRFTPQQMLQQFEERGWDVGLVVDLTYTDRYYEPQVSSRSDTVLSYV